ncbi:MAG: XRE family transcriptional regulator [Deltaproteobacteria bacterium]|nr:MAG: XRE family transcriptional regulator [Deltaproteobacteria bacterium]
MSEPLHQMLLRRRKTMKLSAEAMGARFDVSRNWIQRLESGDMELRVSQLPTIAEAYELSELELMQYLAPEVLDEYRKTLKTETHLQISPSAEFWQEIHKLREEMREMASAMSKISEDVQAVRQAAESAARRAGRVERHLAPLTEQLAMTARDFERAREQGAAFLPNFLEEGTHVNDDDRPRAQLRRPDDLPES